MKLKSISQYLISLIVLLSLTLSIAYFTGETKIIYGTVTGLNAPLRDDGVHPYLIIKLDSNKTITCKIPISSMYQQNARVSIIETSTNLFGIKRYTFNRYIE